MCVCVKSGEKEKEKGGTTSPPHHYMGKENHVKLGPIINNYYGVVFF